MVGDDAGDRAVSHIGGHRVVFAVDVKLVDVVEHTERKSPFAERVSVPSGPGRTLVLIDADRRGNRRTAQHCDHRAKREYQQTIEKPYGGPSIGLPVGYAEI